MAIIPVYPYGTDSEVQGVTTMRAFRVKMERGNLKNTGAMDNSISGFNNYIRSSMLIRTNDATKVTGKTLTGFTVYEYNSSFTLIATSAAGATFNANTRYIKIVKQTTTLSEEVVLLFNGDVEEVYNVQIEKGLFTSGTYNGKRKSEMLVFDVGDGICTTARLLLPSTYSISGKKVPLFIWSACDGSYSSGTEDHGWNNAIDRNDSERDLTAELQYLADQGFAVLNIYPWGSYNNTKFTTCGMSGAIPVPVTLRSYEKAVEYVTSRFNISDTNIFQASHSGSGKLSSYYAIHKPKFNLRAIYAFSPVVDGLCFPTSGAGFANFRKALHSEMNFEDVVQDGVSALNDVWLSGNTIQRHSGIGLAFIAANAEKFAKTNAINWRNLSGQTIAQKLADTVSFGDTWYTESSKSSPDWASLRGHIYNNTDLSITGDGVPITIIGGEDDASCPYLVMEEFVTQLRNGGAEAKIINLPQRENNVDLHPAKGGHRAAVYYHTKSNITARNGQTYTTIPYGWWYAVEDIYARFLKNP